MIYQHALEEYFSTSKYVVVTCSCDRLVMDPRKRCVVNCWTQLRKLNTWRFLWKCEISMENLPFFYLPCCYLRGFQWYHAMQCSFSAVLQQDLDTKEKRYLFSGKLRTTNLSFGCKSSENFQDLIARSPITHLGIKRFSTIIKILGQYMWCRNLMKNQVEMIAAGIRLGLDLLVLFNIS